MDRLVPADEESNPFLDADLGPEPELPAGAPQVGVREPHVPRLVTVALDPHLAAERASDQLDQPIQPHPGASADVRSEEHTSELQSQSNLVCRLLLEKKTANKQGTRHNVCLLVTLLN